MTSFFMSNPTFMANHGWHTSLWLVQTILESSATGTKQAIWLSWRSAVSEERTSFTQTTHYF